MHNHRRSRWAGWLETYPDVRRWYENMQRGSESTAEETIRVLYRCLTNDLLGSSPRARDPVQLVLWAKQDLGQVEDAVLDMIGRIERRTRSGGYVANHVKAIKSWLGFHGIELTRRIKIRGVEATPSIEDEQVPTKEELRSILGAANERGRAIGSFMAFAGLRPMVLGNMRARDGLRIKDLPDLQIDGTRVRFTKMPALVIVRAELSKAGHRYLTFLPQEGCDYVATYLNHRLAEGERLGPESPIITNRWAHVAAASRAQQPQGAKNKGESGLRGPVDPWQPFLTSRNLVREVRNAMQSLYTGRPYALRAYADTQLLLGQSSGKISHAYQQFFMGHKGDMEAKYTTNKGRLPPDMIEDMRRVYKAVEPYLTTTPPPTTDPKDMVLNLARDLARQWGVDPMRVRVEKARDHSHLDAEHETRLLMESMGEAIRHQRGAGQRLTNRIVNGEKELLQALNEGWRLVQGVGQDRFLIERA